MSRALDANFVTRYARPPADGVVERAIKLHEGVRDTLGDADYATVLQGSYKNDTALASMNDVDVLAVVRQPPLDCWSNPKWESIFQAVEAKLEADPRYKGKWKRGDKCIRLATAVNIDVVPAIHFGDPITDPIAVYSFSQGRMRKNWPRGHYEATAKKSKETNGSFKQMVRLLKRWARCQFGAEKPAPSYYLECLVHSLPSSLFTGDVALDFHRQGMEILRRHTTWWLGSLAPPSGDGELLASSEWTSSKFYIFRAALERAVLDAQAALHAHEPNGAKAAWRRAFAGHEP